MKFTLSQQSSAAKEKLVPKGELDALLQVSAFDRSQVWQAELTFVQIMASDSRH